MIDREDVPGKGVDCERCEERVDEWRPWKRGLDGAVIHLDCLLRQRVFKYPTLTIVRGDRGRSS